MVSPILSIQNLSKKFGAVIANEDVSIDLYQGEIHGLIGPNGTGKSTLIKQISGEIKQDSGKIVLAKNDVHAIAYPANSVPPGNTVPVHLEIICPTIKQSIIARKLAAIMPEIL